MITQGYTGSRPHDERYPQAAGWWDAVIETVQRQDKVLKLAVFAGNHYRRQIDKPSLELIGPAVTNLLQFVIGFPKEHGVKTYGQFVDASDQFITNVINGIKKPEVDIVISPVKIEFPERYGPFGAPDASRPPKVFPDMVRATHYESGTRMMLGVEFPGSRVVNDVLPDWGDRDVEYARRGGVIILTPEETEKIKQLRRINELS